MYTSLVASLICSCLAYYLLIYPNEYTANNMVYYLCTPTYVLTWEHRNISAPDQLEHSAAVRAGTLLSRRGPLLPTPHEKRKWRGLDRLGFLSFPWWGCIACARENTRIAISGRLLAPPSQFNHAPRASPSVAGDQQSACACTAHQPCARARARRLSS